MAIAHECSHQREIEELRTQMAVLKSEMKNIQIDVIEMGVNIKAIRESLDKAAAKINDWLLAFLGTALISFIGMAVTVFLALRK